MQIAPALGSDVSVASKRFRALAASSRSELEALLRQGSPPAVQSLRGHRYRGFNHPFASELIRTRKFFKGFFDAGDRTYGFNVRAQQNGLGGEWRPRQGKADPFAFFSVGPAEQNSKYPNGLLLDYGEVSGAALDPARVLRDYLVRVDEASDELLLGKAYGALGKYLMPVGFFILEVEGSFGVGDDLRRRVEGD